MVSTHDVLCCNCRKALAWWSGLGHNIQHEEEWGCNNARIRRKVAPSTVSKLTKAGKRVYLKYDYYSCYISNDSAYCRKCAYKLKFKCKNCKTGRIILKRRR